jgi:aminopeptidase N
LADPGAIHAAREGLKQTIGVELRSELGQIYDRAAAVGLDDPNGRGTRKVKAAALGLLAASDPGTANLLASDQFNRADNMTDRQSALMVLCGLPTPEREAALEAFYRRYAGNDLVIDKWFTLQALSLHPDVITQVRKLAEHPDFTMKNPNRVRSLHMAFAGNPKGFHKADGEGYRMVADVILALDPINPQTAARFVPSLGRWRRIEPGRAAQMKAELERIMAAGNLSRDTFEQVSRSLEG